MIFARSLAFNIAYVTLTLAMMLIGLPLLMALVLLLAGRRRMALRAHSRALREPEAQAR